MKEKRLVRDASFHQLAHGLLGKEVEVITLQGDFTGRLEEIGNDVIILESHRMQQPLRIIIRIETIVAIFRLEARVPRGPFDFPFGGEHFENPPGESTEI